MEVQLQEELPDSHPLSPNYHHFHQELEKTNPDHPMVTRYRREKKFAEKAVAQVDRVEQGKELTDDEQWAQEMFKLADKDEPESKDENLTDDDIIRQFCEGSGVFAN